jgi:uncharacterized protein (TIGR02001 family)
MSFFRYALPLVAGLIAGPALAADVAAVPKKGAVVTAPSPWDFAFGAKIGSDYNFRGISQSAKGISGGAYGEVRYDVFYAGAAFWSTKLPNQPVGEVDLYLGARPTLGPATFDLGFIYYWYPGEKRDVALFLGTQMPSSFGEFYLKPSVDVNDWLNVGGNLAYAWDWLGTGAPGTYLSGTAKVKLPYDFAISGEFGRYFLGTQTKFAGGGAPIALVSYNYWNAGISYTFKDTFTLDARYHGTDQSTASCYINSGDPAGAAGGSTPGLSSWCGHTFIVSLAADLQYSKLPIKW